MTAKDLYVTILLFVSIFATYNAPITGFWWNVLIFIGSWQVTSFVLDLLGYAAHQTAKEQSK